MTVAEVAEIMQCSRQFVRGRALAAGIGYMLGGNAGMRFSEQDLQALLDTMRVPRPVERRRRRRRYA